MAGPLNLSRSVDRAVLAERMNASAGLRMDAAECVDEYRRWFRGPEWDTVYGGDFVTVTAGKMGTGHSVASLLVLTEVLLRLRGSVGFEALVAGLRNATQVNATLFEIAAAGWCLDREVHEAISFAPTVRASSGQKRPDFRWSTALGDVTCECKRAQIDARREHQQTQTLLDAVARAADAAGGVPDGVRLEVDLAGSVGRRVPDMQRLVESLVSDRCVDLSSHDVGPFTVRVVPRAAPFEPRPGFVTATRGTVGTTPVSLDAPAFGEVKFSRSLNGARARAVRTLARAARAQLPEAGPNALFLDVPGGAAVLSTVQEVVQHQHVVPIAFALVCDGRDPVGAAWRDGQPFGRRLLDGTSSPEPVPDP